MTPSDDPADVYRAIGVRPAINATGTWTAGGGTKLRPEAMEAMNKAAVVPVGIHELNRQAGKVLAEIIGAEAAFVSKGAAGGLVLQAAACIAGSDPAKMARLPDTTGLKNEIIIHNSHRFPYDQAYRVAGAKLVGIGDGRRCAPWQLEAAFTDRTAAVAFLQAAFVSRRAIPLEQVCEIAHARGVPVIVDAASRIPPRANLRKVVQQGPDLVIFSGGKGIRGPQGTGILCGRADLIEAAAANASPNQFLGRVMKVAKEEIIGLITALRIFVEEDEEAEMRRFRQMSRSVVDALIEVPGLKVTLEYDDYDYLIPTALMTFTKEWKGQSRDQVLESMAEGDPPIFLHTLGNPDELAVEPISMDDQELETVIRRLREELSAPAARS
jgi:L-seryl-tRNA(Ser) seleniumtransferase